MKGHGRTLAPVGLAVCMMLGIMPFGCGGVTVRQNQSRNRPTLPWITVERLRQCVADYGDQLGLGNHEYHPQVEVDQDGMHRKVTMDGIPRSAYDFGACTRSVLSDMAIPASILEAPPPEDAPTVSRSYVGSPPALLVIVVVKMTEIVVEAALTTVLFGVTVSVAHEVGKEIAEATGRRRRWEKECLEHYVACIDRATRKPGNHRGQSRCANCYDVCDRHHKWPPSVGNGSCEYWKRDWGTPDN